MTEQDELYVTHLGEVFDLDEAKRRFQPAPIIRRYGTWAVTEFGLECLVAPYKIPKGRVGSEHWLQHMLEKHWCIPEDFADALDGGRAYFSGKLKMVPEHERIAEAGRPQRIKTAREKTLRTRFRVMNRDSYRCQLCGATAQDGVRLEVDHKIAVAIGGTNALDNLWTLCFPCNRGKKTDPL